MADYDSDSSTGADDIETTVLLGYASQDHTEDAFSRLGGYPAWFDGKTAPDGSLGKCKVCSGWMTLLLQLNGDLPDKFRGHQRRLYLMSCKKKACRRREGSIRGFRYTCIHAAATTPQDPAKSDSQFKTQQAPSANLGDTLFGVKPGNSASVNPFGPPASNAMAQSNPFASASSLAAKPAQKPDKLGDLTQTFAEKARIGAASSSSKQANASVSPTPPVPWPEDSVVPSPYPGYYIDAEKEFLEAPSTAVPSGARVDHSGEGTGSAAEEKAAFESSMDKTFQRFADRLAQNPEQILRYEFGGQPLLYSKTDAVGKLLSPMQELDPRHIQTVTGRGSNRIPRCGSCGAERMFELQLTPHAITELEAEDVGLEGMDWGTVIFATCGDDCVPRGQGDLTAGYVEEWVGVQWEEIVKQGRAPVA